MIAFETTSSLRPDSHELSAFVSTKWSAQQAALGDPEYAAEQLAERRAEQAAISISEYTTEQLAKRRAEQAAISDPEYTTEPLAKLRA